MNSPSDPALRALLTFPCDCDEAWTARNRHAPDCRYQFIHDYLTDDDIARVIAAAEAAPPKKRWPTDDELAAVTYHEWAAEAAPLDVVPDHVWRYKHGTAHSFGCCVHGPLAAAEAAPPEGTRLILASENLLEFFGTRTEDGRRLTAEWGEPDEHGWYSPTFTAHEAAAEAAPLDVGLREALARAIEGGWKPENIDAGLYHNDPVFHAVVYTIQHAALRSPDTETADIPATTGCPCDTCERLRIRALAENR